ncbi:hypothetical protein TI39_contig4193g00002 [Zymoseptoria brevis]|uniref:Uncharacterized protein n=1 Tax=Zymoseptoria brevis TaxID=1047168 RepID=A0A0F4GAQ1_9PEZI|nr:hypothetical protein TI39_contig4193g00002 [Zymoseptoria brevis]
MPSKNSAGSESARIPHPRTIALERQVLIEIRAGNISEAIRILRLAEHDQQTRKPVTFLDLPAELRNRIYDMSGCLGVMCTQKKKFGFQHTMHADIVSRHNWRCDHDSGMSLIPIPSGMHRESHSISMPDPFDPRRERTSYSYSRSIAQQPDLTRVCRQVRDDTLPMFYGNNHFVLLGDYHASRLRKWLDIIGPSNVALLRTVTLSLGIKPQDVEAQTATVRMAKSSYQMLKERLGQETQLSVAWFDYYAPYFENVDTTSIESA